IASSASTPRWRTSSSPSSARARGRSPDVRRSLRRVWALGAKEVRHVLRDPRTLYLALGMPVVMLLLFGFGVSFDLDHLPVAFVDHDRSASSRELRRRLGAGGELDDVGSVASAADAERLLVRGGAIAAVV